MQYSASGEQDIMLGRISKIRTKIFIREAAQINGEKGYGGNVYNGTFYKSTRSD